MGCHNTMCVTIPYVNNEQTNCNTYPFKLQKIKNSSINNDQLHENLITLYDMLIFSVLLDRFLNRNAWYYDMHGIVTTRVLQ